MASSALSSQSGQWSGSAAIQRSRAPAGAASNEPRGVRGGEEVADQRLEILGAPLAVAGADRGTQYPVQLGDRLVRSLVEHRCDGADQAFTQRRHQRLGEIAHETLGRGGAPGARRHGVAAGPVDGVDGRGQHLGPHRDLELEPGEEPGRVDLGLLAAHRVEELVLVVLQDALRPAHETFGRRIHHLVAGPAALGDVAGVEVVERVDLIVTGCLVDRDFFDRVVDRDLFDRDLFDRDLFDRDLFDRDLFDRDSSIATSSTTTSSTTTSSTVGVIDRDVVGDRRFRFGVDAGSGFRLGAGFRFLAPQAREDGLGARELVAASARNARRRVPRRPRAWRWAPRAP